MSFEPLIPAGGLLGYRVLTSTEAKQRATFEARPDIARDIDYFTRNIAAVKTPDDLVADRRLLRVALGAFGLDEDIDKRAFIRKILAEGTEDPEAFANRFVDPRYARLSRAFGFGDIGGARIGRQVFPQEITSQYSALQFEVAVGAQDESLRVALYFRRSIETYAKAEDPSGIAWLSVLGDLPMRRLFEGAFGLPETFAQLDIDRQRDELKAASRKAFGDDSLAVFTDPANVESAIRKYLARAAAASGPDQSTRGFAALAMLSSINSGLGQTGAQNLVLSLAR